MASVSKRKYWVDPATGKEVRAGTPGAVMRESKRWRIRYAVGAGNYKSVVGYTDRRSSELLGARLEAEAAQGSEGMINQFAKHDRRPLSAHMEDYLRDLEMHGRDVDYRDTLRWRIKLLMGECGWSRLSEVSADVFDEWRRARYGKPGSSGKTMNQFLDAMGGFMNWCARKPRCRIRENPLAGMERLPHTPTFQRRALDAGELVALYTAAPAERYRVYLFAVTTGLRRQEIEDLQWGDVVLDATVPFLHLRDYATKARRSDIFGVRPEVAEMLKAFRPGGWKETHKVFAAVPTVEELLKDLAAAGVKLPEAGDLDRIDFHALRTTLGSFINLANIAERVGMELLRVTDAKLLRRTYCDPRILRTAEAAAALPIPTQPNLPPAPQEQRATGTSDQVEGVDALPDKNRTKKKRRDVPRCAAMCAQGSVVDSSQVLNFGGVAPRDSATCRDLPNGGKVHQLGLEPSRNTIETPVNFKFPFQTGQKSDCACAAGGGGGDTGPEYHAIPEQMNAPIKSDAHSDARGGGGGGEEGYSTIIRETDNSPSSVSNPTRNITEIITDPLLATLIDLWPSLPMDWRQKIVRLSEGVCRQGGTFV